MSKISTRSGFVTAKEANKIFSLSDDGDGNVLVSRLWVYPASAVDSVTKKLTVNQGVVYMGEKTDSGDVTPDVLQPGTDATEIQPTEYDLPVGREKRLKDFIFQADNANDGVWFKYWPAQ